MLKIENLTVEYRRDIEILKNVSLLVPENMVTAVIGPNGAGKSTLVKTIAGLIRPKRGSITLDGVRIDGMSAEERVKHGISVVLQRRSVFPQMTVKENLMLGGWRIRGDKKALDDVLEDVLELFPDLKQRLALKAGSLSGGLQRMLEIARAMMSRPRFLLMDEPSAGLSPIMVRHIYRQIDILRKNNVTIFLVDQNIRQCIDAADHVYVLELGEIKGGGRKEEISESLNNLIKVWLYLEQS
jgi:branched-chain amino acid transport system ATP-binding protein